MTSLKVIARIHSEFVEKFGIPRQSGIVDSLKARIVFEPEYRDDSALRGLEEFSHIWLIWGFYQVKGNKWSPTVRPPRLGGNIRMGVFATRSPNRPNPIGLSCVRLEGIESGTPEGTVLHVMGGDLMDGTPIYDIKPYIPYADCHVDAAAGFSSEAPRGKLKVHIEEKWLRLLPQGRGESLMAVLALDPRPSYQNDTGRVYGMAFAGLEVKFTVSGDILTVSEIVERNKNGAVIE